MRFTGWSIATAVVAMAAALAGAAGAADLDIGSPAPAVEVGHWFESESGKGPIGDFERGRVYVVEFWATWCPPCRASIPHLAALQERYADKGVTIIGVSDEDVDTIDEFLEQESGDETFGDLTRTYRLAADPDGSMNRDYMEASGQGGIPTAFIVGKQGEIEWIGHPMEMDEPLAKIVDGTWDRAAHAAGMQERAEIEARFEELSGLLDEGRADAAVDMLDELVPKVRDERLRTQLEAVRMQVAIRAGGPRAVAAFTAAAEAAGESPERLNELAWAVVQLEGSGGEVTRDLLDAALGAAGKAAELDPENGPVLDTLAHLQELGGDLRAALATQRRAVEHAGEHADEIEAYLAELEERAAGL